MTTAPRLAHSAREAFWPTEDQEALLRAAFSTGADAIRAWRAWTSRNHLVESDLDQGSFRLLPLVYKNLLAHHVDDPLMKRLKGVYRYWWCANLQLFNESVGVIETLHAAGIETMVLKGAALSALYYKDTGVRPMSDIDVLVPPGRVAEAVACLARMGWRAGSRGFADDLRFRHATQLVNGAGREFDLHWHVFLECLQPRADDDLWRRAVPMSLLNARTRTLAPADALLHTIVHGIHWNPLPSIRWVPDSMAILRSAGADLDWDAALYEAERRRLALRFRRGLAYLREAFEAPIPDEVIRRSHAMRASRRERLEYRYITLGPEERSQLFLGYYPYLLLGYLRFARGRGLLAAPSELPDYLRYRLGLPSRADVVWMLLGDAVRKTRKILVPRPAGASRS